MKQEIGSSDKNTTFLWREMFYKSISHSKSDGSILDWVNNIINISNNCNFQEDCCFGCKDNRIFDALLFCMKDCNVKYMIRQKASDGTIKNLQEAMAFIKEFPFSDVDYLEDVKQGNNNFIPQGEHDTDGFNDGFTDSFDDFDQNVGVDVIMDNMEQGMTGDDYDIGGRTNECNICYKTFKSSRKMREHQLSKHRDQVSHRTQRKKSNWLHCDICGQDFTEMETIIEHENEHLKGLNTMKCPLCDIKTTSRYKMEQHIQQKHIEEDKENCKLCSEGPYKGNQLGVHMLSAHKNLENWVCNFCNKTCSDTSTLLNHYNNHIGQTDPQTGELLVKAFGGKCGKCDKEFFREIDRLDHNKYNHTEEQCFQCGDIFENKKKLYRHQWSVHNMNGKKPKKEPKHGMEDIEKNEVCEICFTAFATADAKRKHKLRMHREAVDFKPRTLRRNENPLGCEFCGVDFTNLADRIAHENEHLLGLNSFSCPVCPVKTSSKYLLRQHFEISHQDMLEAGCKMCSYEPYYGLKQKQTLAQHYVTVHCGDDKKICNICGEKYNLTCKLLRHYNSHIGLKDDVTGEMIVKPFAGKCPQCPKEFFRIVDKDDHITQYHNTKPCPYCGVVFPYIQKMNEHIRKEHQEKEAAQSVMCSSCAEIFPNPKALDMHQRKKHGAVLDSPRKRSWKTKEFNKLRLENENGGGQMTTEELNTIVEKRR